MGRITQNMWKSPSAKSKTAAKATSSIHRINSKHFLRLMIDIFELFLFVQCSGNKLGSLLWNFKTKGPTGLSQKIEPENWKTINDCRMELTRLRNKREKRTNLDGHWRQQATKLNESNEQL
jgi:hypothetical protein